jgi:hypothetical protein
MADGLILDGDGDALSQMANLAREAFILAEINAVKEYGLDCPHEITVTDAMRFFNGVGPSWMPEEYRKKLDRYSKTIMPAVLVHDNDFANGDGTMLDFQLANRRLHSNGVKCADIVHKWYNPMRYIVRHQAKVYAKLCDLLGFPAYAAAVEERKQYNHETENKEA